MNIPNPASLLKTWLLLFSLLLLSHFTRAQDIILLQTGDEIKAKITEVNPVDILYKKPDSLQGRTFAISKKEVFLIKYANGAREVITPATQAEETSTRSPEEMFARGQHDAKLFYKGNDAMWGSAGAMLVVGIPGPVVIAAFPPKINARLVPEVRLLENPHYVQGYTKQAHKKKMGKAAAGAGIGVGALVMLVLIVAASLQ